MTIYCNACSQRLGSADELCSHRTPVCVVCCDDEHRDYYANDDDGAAA